MAFDSLAGLRAAIHETNLAQDVTYYGYSSRMGITRGMDLPGMFAVLGGKGAGGSLVTTRLLAE